MHESKYTKQLKALKEKRCEECNGDGYELSDFDSDYWLCTKCKGTGFAKKKGEANAPELTKVLEALKKAEEALEVVNNLADPALRRKCEDTYNRILAVTGPAITSIEDLGKEK